MDEPEAQKVVVVEHEHEPGVGEIAAQALLQALERPGLDLRGHADKRLLGARAAADAIRPRAAERRLLEIRVVGRRFGVERRDVHEERSHEAYLHHAAPRSAGRLNWMRIVSISGSPVSAPWRWSLSRV